MSIIRVSRTTDPFARVPKQTLEDDRMSWKAKGILAYLIGHPHNWEIRCADLVNKAKDGRCSVLSAMKELKKLGYIEQEIIRKNGKIYAKVWHAKDMVDLKAGNLTLENLALENRTLNKNKGKGEREYPRAPRSGTVCFGIDAKTTKYPILVERFAQFSLENKWHIKFNGVNGVTYKKGGFVGGWTRPTLLAWTRACQAIDPERAGKVFDWYMLHFQDEYVPQATTFTSFLDKFDRIESAMKRTQKKKSRENNGEADEEIDDEWYSLTPEERRKRAKEMSN